MGLRWFCFNKLFNWLVNSCHPFDQSHAKLSPVWSHAFSRRFTCFYFELSLAPCNITFVWLAVVMSMLVPAIFARNALCLCRNRVWTPNQSTTAHCYWAITYTNSYHTFMHTFNIEENKYTYFKWMQLLPMLNSNSSLTTAFFDRSNSF